MDLQRRILVTIDDFECWIFKFDWQKTNVNDNLTKLNFRLDRSKLLRTKLNWKLMKLNEEVTKMGGKTYIILSFFLFLLEGGGGVFLHSKITIGVKLHSGSTMTRKSDPELDQSDPIICQVCRKLNKFPVTFNPERSMSPMEPFPGHADPGVFRV